MLQIRSSQVDALTRLVQRRLLADAVDHVRGLDAPRWRDVDDAALVDWTRQRLLRGEALGLVEELALLRHLEVAALHGERFADSGDVLGLLYSLDDLHRWPETSALIALLHAAENGAAAP